MILEPSFLVEVLQGRPSAKGMVRDLDEGGEALFLPSPAVFELWEGASRAIRSTAELERVEELTRRYEVLPFDREDAKQAGLLQALLAKRGAMMGTVDVQIAGMARARNQVLVTGDRDYSVVREWVRVRSTHSVSDPRSRTRDT